jgi:hypothetical protein
MRRHLPESSDLALVRMAGKLDRLERHVADLAPLRTQVEAHTRTLADLADLVRRISSAHSAAAAPESARAVAAAEDDELPPEWLTVTDPAQAVLWLADLHQWIRDVWVHYQSIPPCWPWHPSIVAELLTVRVTWAAATAAGASPTELGTWHDRWRPGTAHRISKWIAGCDRAGGLHVTGPGTRWELDPTVLDEVAEWWATTHGTVPPPGLTQVSHR